MKEIEFINRVVDPICWLDKARDLLWAARQLRGPIEFAIRAIDRENPHMPFGEIAAYYMLINYSFENLFKVLAVINEKNVIVKSMKGKCKIPKGILGHGLFEFAKRYALLKNDVWDESLLFKLERCAVWYGRYPTSTSPKAMNPFYDSEYVDFPVSLTSHSSSDFKDLDSMLDALLTKIKKDASNKDVDAMCDSCAATHASH